MIFIDVMDGVTVTFTRYFQCSSYYLDDLSVVGVVPQDGLEGADDRAPQPSGPVGPGEAARPGGCMQGWTEKRVRRPRMHQEMPLTWRHF